MKSFLSVNLSNFSVALLFLALSFIVYGNTVQNGFVLDDNSYIEGNYLIRSLDNIPAFFNVPEDAKVEDLPAGFLRGRNMRWVTYAVDYAVGQGDPSAFHVSNILWHFFSGFGLYLLVRMWFDSQVLALLAAIIFLVHPIQTNAVAYIFARKDILACGFGIWSIYFWQRFCLSRKVCFLIASFVLLAVAYLSKESAAVVPAIIVMAWLIIEKPDLHFRQLKNLRATQYFCGLLFFCFLAFVFYQKQGVIFSAFNGGATNFVEGGEGMVDANLSFANLILFYFYKMILPINLLADYRGVFDFSLYPEDFGWVVSPVFTVLFALLIYILSSRWREGAVGLGWIFLTLLPVSHLIPFYFPVAEHYMYLPFAGFSIVVASLLLKVLHKNRFFGVSLIIVVLVLFSTMTIARNRVWYDMETLTADILTKAPDHYRARSTLVHLLTEQGKDNEAIGQAKKILRLNPKSAVTHYNLGVLYEKTNPPSAIFHYRQAIRFKPTLWNAYLNLGDFLLVNGHEAEGLAVIDQLMGRYGYHPLAYWVVGNYYARNGDWRTAEEKYREAIDVDPYNAPGWLGIAGAEWYRGNRKPAFESLNRSLENGIDLDWAVSQNPWSIFLEEEEISRFVEKNR